MRTLARQASTGNSISTFVGAIYIYLCRGDRELSRLDDVLSCSNGAHFLLVFKWPSVENPALGDFSHAVGIQMVPYNAYNVEVAINRLQFNSILSNFI